LLVRLSELPVFCSSDSRNRQPLDRVTEGDSERRQVRLVNRPAEVRVKRNVRRTEEDTEVGQVGLVDLTVAVRIAVQAEQLVTRGCAAVVEDKRTCQPQTGDRQPVRAVDQRTAGRARGRIGTAKRQRDRVRPGTGDGNRTHVRVERLVQQREVTSRSRHGPAEVDGDLRLEQLRPRALRRRGVFRGGLGGRGGVRSVMLVSSSRRSPLRWLQGAHDVTTFSHTEVPPRERGTTWSSVRRFPSVPQ